MNLENKKVLVFGAGVSGIGSAQLLIRAGAQPVVYDANTKLKAEDILKRLHSNIKPSEKISNLSNGEMQILQIAKALYLDTKVISLDEPTASLSSRETEILFEIIDDLKARGITIIYITHRMDEIFKLADRATVMRDGKYIGTYDIDKVTKEELIFNMVGRDVSMFAVRQRPLRANYDHEVLKVTNLNVDKRVRNANFSLYKGEILGFFGLVGAGRTDVVRAVFGADKRTSGEVSISGKAVDVKCPSDAVKHGIALIPEDRKQQGFNNNFTNAQNISLAALEIFTRQG
jgi:ribose transport system ATP-binding protein